MACGGMILKNFQIKKKISFFFITINFLNVFTAP